MGLHETAIVCGKNRKREEVERRCGTLWDTASSEPDLKTTITIGPTADKSAGLICPPHFASPDVPAWFRTRSQGGLLADVGMARFPLDFSFIPQGR